MILINLCEISKNGQVLHIHAQTDSSDKVFKLLVIKHISTGVYFNLTQLLMDEYETYSSSTINFEISIEDLYNLSPEIKFLPKMFLVGLVQAYREEEEREEERFVYVSDVSIVYRYLLDHLSDLSCEQCCVEIPIEVLRVFALLYAHKLALEVGDIDQALLFYKAIYKSFSNCPSNKCGRSVVETSKSCGCHG